MTDPSNGSVFGEQSQETPAQEQQQQQAPANGQENGQQGQQQQPAQQSTASSGDVFADQLASIKNERGEPKYKDLPTAIEALKHSQEYIPQVKQENETLKQELDRLKAELEQRGSLEETVERLTARQREEAAPSPQEMQGLTPEQVEELLEQRLTQREQRLKAQANETQVSEAITAKYGEKAREVVQSKAQEYGMTPAEMQQWAAKNPKAVLALFEVKPTPQGNKPSSSSVNIPPVRPNDSNELQPPEKSLLRGASMKDQMEYMRRVRESTNKRLGIEN
tara:strand:- start:788 stop:1624 length:837 start_codon:yes stop_codon:yes gene_type:complete